MKQNLYTVILAGVFMAGCERPPVTKDLDRSLIGQTKIDRVGVDYSNMESSPEALGQAYELQFIDSLIVHQQGTIEMAMLANTRAQHSEIKTLAQIIIVGRQSRINQMKKWRGEMFAGKPAAINMDFPGMRDGMRQMDLRKLDSLKANEFDLEFIKQLIPLNNGAIAMATDAALKTPSDPAGTTPIAESFRNLTASMLKAKEAELKQLREWQILWSKKP